MSLVFGLALRNLPVGLVSRPGGVMQAATVVVEHLPWLLL